MLVGVTTFLRTYVDSRATLKAALDGERDAQKFDPLNHTNDLPFKYLTITIVLSEQWPSSIDANADTCSGFMTLTIPRIFETLQETLQIIALYNFSMYYPQNPLRVFATTPCGRYDRGLS